MGSPVKVTREEHTAHDLRRVASDIKDAGQVRRMQAISFVMDGWSRAAAAAFACVDRQTLRDWVEHPARTPYSSATVPDGTPRARKSSFPPI